MALTPFRTAGMVFARILKSIHERPPIDVIHFEFIQCSNETAFRPLTYNKHVIPNRKMKRSFYHLWLSSTRYCYSVAI